MHIKNNKHFILGGARSGNSPHAERVIQHYFVESQSTSTVYYIATAEALDQEMRLRIERHQNDRQNQNIDFEWNLIEEPIQLGKIIESVEHSDIALIDCLTLWISNCLHHESWSSQKPAFIETILSSKATIVMASNEVGQGIVPMGQLSRQFVDESGWLHQQLSPICDHVEFVTAGLIQRLK